MRKNKLYLAVAGNMQMILMEKPFTPVIVPKDCKVDQGIVIQTNYAEELDNPYMSYLKYFTHVEEEK